MEEEEEEERCDVWMKRKCVDVFRRYDVGMVDQSEREERGISMERGQIARERHRSEQNKKKKKRRKNRSHLYKKR